MLKLAVYSGIVRACGTVLGAIASISLARILGVDGYGIYAYALSIATLVGVLGQFGLPMLVVRETAALAVQQDHGAIWLFRRWAMRLALRVSVIVMTTGLAIAWIAHHATDASTLPIAIALILVPLIAAEQVNSATLRGLNRTMIGQVPEYLIRPLLFLLLILVSYLTLAREALLPEMMVAAYAASVACSLLFTFSVLNAHCRRVPRTRQIARESITRWTASLLPFSVLGGSSVLVSQTDLVMLGLLTDSASVGIYRVATQVAALVVFGLSAVNAVIAPRMAALYQQKDFRALRQVAVGAARLSASLAAIVVLVLLLAGEQLVSIVFGHAFRAATTPLLILAVGQLCNAGMGSVGYLLNMTGFERDSMQGFAIAATLNLVLNAILIPLWSVTGAAIATSASIIVWNLVLTSRVKRRLGMSVGALSLTRASGESR